MSAALMALGAVFAVSDRRYRVRASATESAGEPTIAQGSAAEAS
jgi:hypothetical protein